MRLLGVRYIGEESYCSIGLFPAGCSLLLGECTCSLFFLLITVHVYTIPVLY